MGLNNVTSFAIGGAAAAGPLTMNQVWLSSQNTTAILYTVPSGKYFKGYIGHNGQYYPKVNGIVIHSYWNNAITETNANAGTATDIILCAGTTVQASSNNGNYLMILGVEYDIPTSGISSGVNL